MMGKYSNEEEAARAYVVRERAKFLRRARDLLACGGQMQGNNLAEKLAAGFYDDYLRDKYEENLAKLAAWRADAAFVELYEDLIAKYPQLRAVALCRPQDLGLSEAQICYKSSYIYQNTDGEKRICSALVYPFGGDVLAGLKRAGQRVYELSGDRDESARRMAVFMGLRPDYFERNPQLLVRAVFLHEFGHAVDEWENFYTPLLVEISEEWRAFARVAAAGAFDEYVKAGHVRQIQLRLAQRLTCSERDLFAFRLRGYASSSKNWGRIIANTHKIYASELAADYFARDYLFDELVQADSYELDAKDLWSFGLYGASGVCLASGLEGFLADELCVGEPVYWSDGDFETREVLANGAKLRAVTVRTEPDFASRNISRNFELDFEGGMSLEMTLNGAMPTAIAMSRAEAMDYLNLNDGDECYALIVDDSAALAVSREELIESTRSDTKANSLLGGKICLGEADSIGFELRGRRVDLLQAGNFRRYWNSVCFDALMPGLSPRAGEASVGRRMTFELLPMKSRDLC